MLKYYLLIITWLVAQLILYALLPADPLARILR